MGCSLWLAMFRVKQEKIAINELSKAIFKFQVAFTVVKICRFFVTVGVKDPVLSDRQKSILFVILIEI